MLLGSIGGKEVSWFRFSKNPSNTSTIIFMVILSFVCALILSFLASVLAKPKEIARELDRSMQMLIAAKILSPDGYFTIQNQEGEYIPAVVNSDGILVPGSKNDVATRNDLLHVYQQRIRSRLMDQEGKLVTFKEAGIDEDAYLADFKKSGYYREPYKLLYEIMPNPTKESEKSEQIPTGYVIPVNGYGLWDAIYGYIAIAPDGNTVLGISWYDQKETPGLGANITEPSWQHQFLGKHIFQESADGTTDYKTAPLGIVVVRGKVAEVLGNSPKAKSAVDGMAGATLTGNGVTQAYREVLGAYRPFFIRIHQESENGKGSTNGE